MHTVVKKDLNFMNMEGSMSSRNTILAIMNPTHLKFIQEKCRIKVHWKEMQIFLCFSKYEKTMHASPRLPDIKCNHKLSPINIAIKCTRL
jgi:hypothetical protein